MSTIIKWTPQDLMGDEDRDWGNWFPMMRVPRTMMPAVDVYEDGDQVVVETTLVGVDPKDVNIEIEDNVLKISGQSKHKSEVDEKNYYRQEIRYGNFQRAVALPKAVVGDKADASYKDGVLKISIPKAEEAKPRKIPIKSS
jgi:HSP20 family protein